MKYIKFGNILTEVTDGIIVHGCNARGAMGSGIALQIKTKWPNCYTTYVDAITDGRGLGTIVAWAHPTQNLIVANAIIQNDFGKDGRQYVKYSAIHRVFTAVALAAVEGFDVHYPLIGAGLGGGNWSIISDIIDECFAPYPEINRTLWLLE